MDLRDVATRSEIGRALNRELAHQLAIIKESDSIAPVWVRDGTVAAENYYKAQERLAWLSAASKELKMYGDDLNAHR